MNKKKRKPYKRITAETIAKHKAAVLIEGNGTRAVELLEPEYSSPKDRAHKIAKKGNHQNINDYIENSLQQIGEHAIQRVSDMVQSTDERIATKNSHYVIDHIRGKAVQRTDNRNLNINIQSVLD
ncbi:hypothetical protein EKK58_09480 [Candidatus Dependentiae bacterium]|nr:MAG: hypothetical protein EKK58_09480 [Candidatus Dependentiae bacterium]